MLTAFQRRRIIELHRIGMSQREIARRCECSRERVSAVVNGTYRDPEPGQFDAERRLGLSLPPVSPSRFGRCPRCGAKVSPPCFACQIREVQNA